MQTNFDFIVIGGGAAGFFAAINAAEMYPGLEVAILERGKEVLTKVKVSGGGRCNVTHAEFDPAALSDNYPRGNKELLGPFHHFMTGDTIEWFEERGVALKTEEDGRMFPISDNSQSIIDCFLNSASENNIEVLTQHAVKSISKEDSVWKISTSAGDFSAARLLVASGSNQKVWNMLEKLGHTIVPAVPSLFTFNIEDERITHLAGVSVLAEVKVLSFEGKPLLESDGPLLITHWGMSGPAILKLSAWGARILAPLNYKFDIEVNWLNGKSIEAVIERLQDLKLEFARKRVGGTGITEIPKRLWKSLVEASAIDEETTWADINKKQLISLAEQLCIGRFKVDGKSTFKEEFVTAGGVDLTEVNFKTFESKIHKGLYLAGEVLNIDAITGGFNFQNAWTGAYLVAGAVANG